MEHNWIHEAAQLAKQDAAYQACLKEVAALEPAYLQLLSRLDPEDRKLLEDYITACEALDDAYAHIVYTIK